MRKCCGVRATALAGRSSLSPDIRHLDLDRDLAAVALHGHRHPLSHPDALELLDQVGQPAHRLAVDADDDVPRVFHARVYATEAGSLRARTRCGSPKYDALRT